jgi:Flp pilus assembly pilin Flp
LDFSTAKRPLRIFLLKIAYELKFYRVTCYFINMNSVHPATFSSSMLSSLMRRRTSRRGQTLVEYALILAIISVVAIGVMISLGKQVTGVYSTITSVVASAQASH